VIFPLILVIAASQAAPAPASARVWVERAETFAKQKDMARARSAALTAEKLGARDPEIFQALANLYATALKDPPKAAALGARYAELSPRDRTAWRRLAAYCLNTGQPDKAIAAGKRGLAADNSAEFHSIVGQAHAARKDWANAVAEMSAALKLNPYDEQIHFQFAQVYLVQQDFASAAGVLENARKIFDKSPQIELALGVAYYGWRKFPEAVTQFLKTMDLAPDVPQPYLFLGRMMDQLGERLPEVAARFEAFEKRNPSSPVGYLLHAKALIARLPPTGFPSEANTALQLLEKSRSLNDSDAETHLQMGLMLERKGDYPAAAAALERAVKLSPKGTAARFPLARVYDRLGRSREAAEQRALHEKLGEAEKQ
jgi:tetratricopeptide (TPR) repeat protein